MTPTLPFNPHRRTHPPPRWQLRTQKLVGMAWVTLATFPTLPAEHQADQRERLQRHAEAFGGLVRLMRAELLLASWQDGVLEVDLRGEVAA